MAKNNGRNTRDSDDDERLGTPGAGARQDIEKQEFGGAEPLIPLGAQQDEDEVVEDFSSGDHRYARDDSDRLGDEREHDERDYSDEERLEMFRLSLFQNQLPSLPTIPDWHTCWLTTANPRDSIQGRIRLGYKLINPNEIPGWEANVLGEGPFKGYIGINEMVAAKLPMRLYEMYMTEAHHNQPLAEEGKLRATLDAIKQSREGQRVTLIEEEGTASLGTKRRRAHFEDIHGPRRSPVG